MPSFASARLPGSAALGLDRVVWLLRLTCFAVKKFSGHDRKCLTAISVSVTDQPHTTTKVPVKIVVAAPERTSAAIRFISGLATRSCVMRHCRIAKTAMLQRSMTKIESPDQLTDGELLAQVTRAAKQERAATAHLIALLAEVDARRLYLGEGYSSLFTYCTQALHLSEHAAYGRIEAARAARRFPVVMDSSPTDR